MDLRIPSKTFLLGEYAVLWGSNALMIGHGPWFEAVNGGETNFHPNSPAGKLLAGKQAPFIFQDPHGGAGGFGGSGAEFVAAFAQAKSLPTTLEDRRKFAWSAWDAYQGNSGSGCDVLTMSWGINHEGPLLLALDLHGRTIESLHNKQPYLHATLSLFRTGKKLQTHEHLATLPPIPWEELAHIEGDGEEALRSGSPKNLGDCMTSYSKRLKSLGLVAEHSFQALHSLPRDNIFGAKGCGAMGCDVIAVLHDHGELDKWARDNLLSPVAELPL